MGKVSIGLRGWRFEESNVFTEDGEFKMLEEMPAEDRKRVIRLPRLMERPCDACYLVHGEEEKQRCGVAAVVYGEPFEEIVLCDDHERDFFYWYREAGGADRRGTEAFKAAFHEWFDEGGRAPEEFDGPEHVDTDPENMPDPPDPEEIQDRLESGVETQRIDLRESAARAGDDEGDADDGEGADADPLDLDDVDLDREYPS